MENTCIFAVDFAKVLLNKYEKSSNYFYGYKKAIICKDKGLSNHNGLLHSCCNLTLASRGAIAFLILFTLIFHYMPKSNENASKVNNSILTSTSAHETGIQPRFTVSEDTANFIDCLNAMDNVYSHVYKALEHMYCDKTAEELMEKEFNDTFFKTLAAVKSFLLQSISSHVGYVNSTEI